MWGWEGTTFAYYKICVGKRGSFAHPDAFFGFLLYVCLKEGRVWNINKVDQKCLKWSRRGLKGPVATVTPTVDEDALPGFWHPFGQGGFANTLKKQYKQQTL